MRIENLPSFLIKDINSFLYQIYMNYTINVRGKSKLVIIK